MIPYFLFALLILGVIALLIRSRNLYPKRHWNNQTNSERLLLSIVFAGFFQFLFLMPGWIVAVYIIGKGVFAETVVGNLVFGLLMLIANTIIYLPFFYLLIGWLSSWHRKSSLETH